MKQLKFQLSQETTSNPTVNVLSADTIDPIELNWIRVQDGYYKTDEDNQFDPIKTLFIMQSGAIDRDADTRYNCSVGGDGRLYAFTFFNGEPCDGELCNTSFILETF